MSNSTEDLILQTLTDKGYGIGNIQIETHGKFTHVILYVSRNQEELSEKLRDNGVKAYLMANNGIELNSTFENLQSAVEEL